MKTAVGLCLLVLLMSCVALKDRPMQLKSGSSPIYPSAARAEGVEGAVVVRYGVSVDGRVINARIDSAQPSGVFEEAALKAVRSWRYNPAIRDGSPVAVDNILSTVRFELGDGGEYEKY